MSRYGIFAVILSCGFISHAQRPSISGLKPAAVSSILSSELLDFDTYPKQIQQVIAEALELTHKQLTYTFGSSDPATGGMDCSGTIYYLLQHLGINETPRQSDELCLWVKEKSALHLTPHASALNDPEFALLHPGDLLFWSGTYASGKRETPVTHVMLYLGKLKTNGHAVMFGASDGRRFAGESRCGVSVFDFELPKEGGKSAFYGYGPIPGMIKEEIKKPTVKP